MIKRLDAFDELSAAPDRGPIGRAVRSDAIKDEERLVAYLRSAPVVLDVMERLSDLLDGSDVEATGSLCTDGEWYWREDLAHYVEKYHVRLAEDFVQHVRGRDFAPAQLTAADLAEATRLVVQDWSG